MKTSLIFVLGLAVLTVAVARVLVKELENEAGEQEPHAPEASEIPFENTLIRAAEWAQKNDVEYRKAVDRKSQPGGKQKFKKGIPLPYTLTFKSDPIALGRKIAKMDQEREDKRVRWMNHLVYKYTGTMWGDFYKAAIEAIDFPEQASQEWKRIIKIVNNYGEKMAKNFPQIDNLFDANTPLEIANDIFAADPIGAAKSSGIPIILHIGTGSSGSLVVTSSFNTISSTSGRVKGTIQRLILDRIEEKGGVDQFYRKFFNSPTSELPNTER